jgi:hypothetical protein
MPVCPIQLWKVHVNESIEVYMVRPDLNRL